MALNKASMGKTAQGLASSRAFHPADNMQQMGTSAPLPPPQVNTAILLNQVENVTNSVKARLANLTDAIVGNEGCNAGASPTPSGLNERLQSVFNDLDEVNANITRFMNYWGIEV